VNTLVASYAPKTKKIEIAAGFMIASYAKLWNMICEELGLEMYLALHKSLRSRDRKKTNKVVVQRTTSGKKRQQDGEYK